jgi:uncharacterized protein YegP (UPF0339 family)
MYYKIKKSSNGRQFYFTLNGDNNENMATSEMYDRKSSAEHAIEVIKKGAASGRIVDQT